MYEIKVLIVGRHSDTFREIVSTVCIISLFMAKGMGSSVLRVSISAIVNIYNSPIKETMDLEVRIDNKKDTNVGIVIDAVL